MKNKKLFSLALLAIALGAQGQTVSKLSATKVNDYGLVYSLPNTVLDITIESEFVERTPGEFYNYAKRNLNAQNAITEPSITARVKSFTITPRGEADPENRWVVDFKGGGIVNMYLNEANVPVAINTEDFKLPAKPKLPEPQAAEPTPLESPAAQQAITQDMILSSSTSKRAQLAAERIFELRENRSDLISGQADNTPPDGKSMQLALDNLSAQEAALTAMFVGTERRWTEVTTLTYVPYDEEVKNFILARLSPSAGIVGSDDLTGTPIYLSMEILSQGEMPKDDKGVAKPFPKNGVAYQVPGTALISLTYDGQEIASKQVDLAQLGITYGMDPKLFNDKKAPASVTFDPATGAILSLGVSK
ncbi:MAG: DUF4831 family protein [Bacteroidales bacterium]|nr:DUF4831 family protein [Bacteroidales bacterium]